MAARKDIKSIDLSRFAKQSSSRESRKIVVKFLIVCEGESTEPFYFREFHRNQQNIHCDVDCQSAGKKTAPRQILNKAITLKENSGDKYDRIWIVFDKDETSDAEFNKVIQDAGKNGIQVAWSNEAFEIWYILHYNYMCNCMARANHSKALEDAINKGKSKSKFTYSKTYPKMYAILADKQKVAISNAENVLRYHEQQQYAGNFAKYNSGTKVHILVKELNNESPELSKIIAKRLKK